MANRTFEFFIENTRVLIEVDLDQLGRVLVPFYHPSNIEMHESFMCCDPYDFEEEIKDLLPRKLNNYLINECWLSLAETSKKHIRKYGRLLPADLQTYACESLLIMSAVSKSIGKAGPTEEEKQTLFLYFVKKLVNELDL